MAVDELGVGSVIANKYEILGKLGEGGMGLVYRGIHRDLGRPIAIKTLLPELGSSPDLIARFEQEARAASNIGHPNIVNVFDLGRMPGGTLYLVMELLDGESLEDRIESGGPLPIRTAAGILLQLLAALGAAHKLGIVHRDLKPENLFLCPGDDDIPFLKVLDFGVSKVLRPLEFTAPGQEAIVTKTQAGSVVGTPLYMAPEQAQGRPDIDHRTDLWATGAVAYSMLTARTPFDGDNYHQVLFAVLSHSVVPPSRHRADIPRGLEAILMKALTKDRRARYETASAMRQDLLQWNRGASPAAAKGPSPLAGATAEAPMLSDDTLSGLERAQLMTIDGSDANPAVSDSSLKGTPASSPLAPASGAGPGPEPASSPTRGPMVDARAFAPPRQEEPKLELDYSPPPESKRLSATPTPAPVSRSAGLALVIAVGMMILAVVSVLWAMRIL